MKMPATRNRRSPQLGFAFRTWGGKRRGAGRKPRVPGRPGVSHRARPPLASRYPVHVTLSVEPSLPSLRASALYPQIEDCFREGKQRAGFRLVHFSVQRWHLHLIVESVDALALSRGLQALCIRIAKRINRAPA
jgi:hypothetical protein